MLDNVRRNAAATGLLNISTVTSAAENLPTSEALYDAAI
jgi:hypothetical protein